MSRGLTAEKARERRERGLCPRHDIPAQPGGVLCARCLGKVSTAQLYRVSDDTLAAMRAAVASPYRRATSLALLALWLVACPVGAATYSTGMVPWSADTVWDSDTNVVAIIHRAEMDTTASWPIGDLDRAFGYRVEYVQPKPWWKRLDPRWLGPVFLLACVVFLVWERRRQVDDVTDATEDWEWLG